MTGLYCSHERLAASCEDCAFEAAKKAGIQVPPALRPEDGPTVPAEDVPAEKPTARRGPTARTGSTKRTGARASAAKEGATFH